MPLEVRRVVVVSTAHLTEASARLLETLPVRQWPCAGGPYSDFGWFLYAHEENGVGKELIPDDIFAVMTWARKEGFDYLLVDRDGDEVKGLPVHAW